MKAKQPKKDIQQDVKLEIHKEEGEAGGTYIRVVRWLIDGKPTQPFLEKRRYSIRQGVPFMGKAVGFTKSDLNILVKSWDAIAEAMNG